MSSYRQVRTGFRKFRTTAAMLWLLLAGGLAAALLLPEQPVFIAANLSIMAGYVFLAVGVVPKVTMHLRRTRWGGIAFFFLCGLHHLENVLHLLFAPAEPVRELLLSWHMLVIDVPQAVAVIAFGTGLYLEMVEWGPWSGNKRPSLPPVLGEAQP